MQGRLLIRALRAAPGPAPLAFIGDFAPPRCHIVLPQNLYIEE
jgi:hypothetical protein